MYTELKKRTICCLLTKQGGGSDRSLKGLDGIFIKTNDAMHFGGLNNTCAKVACDMKEELQVSVGVLVSEEKNCEKSFQKTPLEIKFHVSTSG